jgi:hypothetical protein
MLSRIPILDVAPEDYEPTPQLGWFVSKDENFAVDGNKTLYQLWQQVVFSEKPSPEQIWVRVATFNRPELVEEWLK